ncbi:piggyBac transposable element-derived protein 4-like [Stegodyphus dumicola]|uniref:piggyBac transposable element-derived protein 4-like n=1 Tax=Stegodyphus dumicola TaxID=202533 RepID=UPI0015B357BA|nr:piggyBac transposable element-derived protein 4-like [Stegodyphus dumicola]
MMLLSYFELFFDNSLMDIILTETNGYAFQHPGSSQNLWSPITMEELYIFLAITILQGIIRKPEIRMYWSKVEIFQSPIFPKLLSFRRYSEIKRYLHFSNNETYDAEIHPHPKLNKIWPVFDHINKKCSSLYTPERDIRIDESLLLYKGRMKWKQYIPLKRARFGIKMYLLCESKTGYLYSSIIYTGKGTNLSDAYREMPVSTQVVLSLIEPLLDKGYCLTTDNFYTSPQLADFLVKRQTDTYGTLKSTRKEVPSEIRNKKLKKGDVIAFQRGKVMAMKWKDKKDVCLLSTIHNTHQENTSKTANEWYSNKETQKL